MSEALPDLEKESKEASKYYNPNLEKVAKYFHDLTPRTFIFRSKLLEEFQLMDSLNENNLVQTPIFSSNDITGERNLWI
jgi:hypothetical protein